MTKGLSRRPNMPSTPSVLAQLISLFCRRNVATQRDDYDDYARVLHSTILSFNSLARKSAALGVAILGTAMLQTHWLPAQEAPDVVRVEAQPLAANLMRLVDALDYLGHPLPDGLRGELREADGKSTDSIQLQKLVDPQVLFSVSVNPELRVKVARGRAPARLQQGGFTPCLIKILNAATVTRELRIASPQAGPVYSGAALGILERQAQTELADNENIDSDRRFLAVELFDKSPMTPRLSAWKWNMRSP
jgi:hypothetical protein